MERDATNLPDGVIVLPPNGGRSYEMGALRAVFKADEAESQARYCISEWWLQPNTEGPGAHFHTHNDEVFYVLEGTPQILVGEQWLPLEKGGFVLIPQGIMHDFRNTSDAEAGLLNFFIPGGFERKMPAIVQWFAENR
jgi:mannose-6-phosphate isomerase-like protein (cupin superfamily)